MVSIRWSNICIVCTVHFVFGVCRTCRSSTKQYLQKNMFSNQSDEPAKYHGTRDRHTILPRRDDTTDPQCNAFGIRALKCRHRSTDLVGQAHLVFSEYSKYKNKQQSLYGNDHFAKCDTKSSSLSFHIFILSSAIVAFFVSSAAWHSATCMILMPTHLYHYYADAFDYAGTVDAVAANGLCSLRMQSLSAAPPHKQTNKSIDCHYCCCWCVVCVCMVCVGMNGSLFSSVWNWYVLFWHSPVRLKKNTAWIHKPSRCDRQRRACPMDGLLVVTASAAAVN